jgi:putative ABC transport system permease protein
MSVLKLPLIEGRWISDADREGNPPVVVINSAMAKTFFHGESPIGRRLQVGALPDSSVPWMEVVGVVGDVKQSLASDAATEMYVPFRQADQVLPVYTLSVVVRTQQDPTAVTNDLRAAIHQLNPNQPVVHIRTMQENLATNIAQPRFRTVLLSIFAAVALVIAAVGIYGVMAYSTSQRSREMGIRMALGSSTRQIFELILADGMRLTGIGVVVGAIGALIVGGYVKKLLFAISTTDAFTMIAATTLVIVVGLLASFMPARRASQVPISDILRES